MEVEAAQTLLKLSKSDGIAQSGQSELMPSLSFIELRATILICMVVDIEKVEGAARPMTQRS